MVAKTNNSKLKFAALIRVSTVQQEKKGESLTVQKAEIKKAVDSLGGKIVGWFGGQEHGTQGFEKKEIDRLLSDAKKKKFNAFICAHADRWSRDNQKSHQGLQVLSEANVRFFVLNSEYDLLNAEHLLFLEMSAVFGAFQARNQKDKSIRSRISRAKRGLPSCGSLPFGRLFDKDTGTWSVDVEKKALVEDLAQRYLEGEKLTDMAIEYGIDRSSLHRILTQRCGNLWEQVFHYKGQEIKVKTKIDRLLPEATIRAIRKRAEANKTYTHGQIKNSYLLGRVIFCRHCGYAMFGQTASGKYHYYRHTTKKHKKNCSRPKSLSNQVKAEVIEDTVITYLFEMFGDPLTVQKAIEKATPNLKKLEQEQVRIKSIEKELKKIEQGRNRILNLIINEKLTESQASKELDKLKARENLLTDEMNRLFGNQANHPTSKQIQAISEKVSKQFKRSVRVPTAKRRSTSKAWFEKMKYKDKRALVEMVFSGKTVDGKRMGVYIEWDGGGGWTLDLHGHLIDKENLLPDNEFLSDEDEVGSKQDELLSTSAAYTVARQRIAGSKLFQVPGTGRC